MYVIFENYDQGVKMVATKRRRTWSALFPHCIIGSIYTKWKTFLTNSQDKDLTTRYFSQPCTRKIERRIMRLNIREVKNDWRIFHIYFHVLLINIVYINNTSLMGKIELLRRQLMLSHKA